MTASLEPLAADDGASDDAELAEPATPPAPSSGSGTPPSGAPTYGSPAPGSPAPGAPPFGPGATLFAGVLLIGGYFVLQVLALMLAAVVVAMVTAGPEPGAAAASTPDLLSQLGLLFWVSALLAAPLASAAVVAVAWAGVRHRPAPRRELRLALGFVAPRWRHVFGWLAVTAAVLYAYELAAVWLDRPEVPEFVEQLVSTAGWFPGLLFAVVVLAPLFEELVFRGFLVPGLAAGRPGALGAALISAGLFAVTHATQYDLFDLSFVLVLGLVFSFCRLHTNSTWLCLLLHAAVNALAAWPLAELAG